MESRSFRNPFLENVDAISAEVDDPWLLEAIVGLIPIMLPDKVGSSYMKSVAPYDGSSGIAFALLKTLPHINNTDEVKKHIHAYLSSISKAKEDKHRATRYITGYLGALTTKAYDPSANLEEIAKEMEEMGSFYLSDHSGNELFCGRAGFLQAVSCLRYISEKSYVSDNLIKSIIAKILKDGTQYAHRVKASFPLMFEYHNTEYIGAAHGVAGILCAILCFVDLLTNQQKEQIQKTADAILETQYSSGNFPSSSGYICNKTSPQVHWCHGAPGVIYLALALHHIYKVPKYMEFALKSGECIWNYGFLKKGPSLCHGLAGNGYPFIYLWRATGNIEWLKRAKAFAALIIKDGEHQQIWSIKLPADEVYSLYEGYAGSLCYFVDLLECNQKTAHFPLAFVPYI